MPTISYEEFSKFYDTYERYIEIKQHRDLSESETSHCEWAGISIASLPIIVAQDYLSRKHQQLKNSIFHAEEVISRLNNVNK